MNKIREKSGFTLIELLVVVLITVLLAMPLLALRGQSRERTWQTRCTANLHIIYAAIQNYADDNDGWICPFYDAPRTWEELLKPYTYGGKWKFYFDSEYKLYDPLLFYCPKRYTMGQSGSNSGYSSNYTVNMHVMGDAPSSSPWGPPGTGSLRKFEDFQDPDNIGILFESQGWVSATISGHPEWLDYVHYNRTNVLMLNGTVKRYKMQSPFPVKMRDD